MDGARQTTVLHLNTVSGVSPRQVRERGHSEGSYHKTPLFTATLINYVFITAPAYPCCPRNWLGLTLITTGITPPDTLISSLFLIGVETCLS
jgi:hypothetical protein